MSGHLVFDPLLPTALIGLFGGAALIVAVLAAFLRLRGSLARAVLAAALALVLLNPVWLKQQRAPLNDVAVLVTDASGSMALDGRSGLAKAAAQAIRAHIAADPTLDLIEQSVPRSGDGTALFGAIEKAVNRAPPGRLAGVMVLSDGLAHDQLDPARLPGAPVHALITGDPGHGDRALRIINAPRYGLVGKPAQFIIHIDDKGQPAAATALVSLRVDGGKPLQVRVAVGRDVKVTMPIHKRGSNVVEIAVEAAPEELTLVNNRTAVNVNGIRERLRVLLVTGEPYAGVRAWRNLLKSDPAVDLVHFTILRPPLKFDPAPVNEMALIAFPTRELFVDKLKGFDLVIFDRYTRRGVLPMLYLDNIARYVEQGGALLVVAGPEFAGPYSLARTPLATILPARPLRTIDQAFAPAITPLGLRHPVTAALARQAKSWGRWGRRIAVSSFSGTAVLAGGKDGPLLILDHVVDGRVALLMSDQAWLWARDFDGGGPHAELYRRLAHWLMKEPELEEEALRAHIKDGVLTVQRQTLADKAAPVSVTAPDGQTKTLDLQAAGPGQFAASMPAAMSGLYSVRSGKMLAVASGGALNPVEYADLIPSAKALLPLVQKTGGGVFALRSAADLPAIRRTGPRDRQAGRTWIGLKRNHAYVVTGEQRKPLLRGLLAALALLGLAALIWWREGHG